MAAARESFPLAGQTIDHGAPVSFLVSSSHGFGMTEGWAEIGDGKTRLRIEVDRATAPLLGLLTHRRIRRQSILPDSACRRWSWTTPASRNAIGWAASFRFR